MGALYLTCFVCFCLWSECIFLVFLSIFIFQLSRGVQIRFCETFSLVTKCIIISIQLNMEQFLGQTFVNFNIHSLLNRTFSFLTFSFMFCIINVLFFFSLVQVCFFLLVIVFFFSLFFQFNNVCGCGFACFIKTG